MLLLPLAGIAIGRVCLLVGWFVRSLVTFVVISRKVKVRFSLKFGTFEISRSQFKVKVNYHTENRRSQ